ncbi:unnamed protein product [Clonostachys chloroleuca]|uniref:Uncharacterized protein n=1 Tax=Clonostachys chloroleuca TaxID=1926264 RepID=A0AA35LVM6_9HYPO|nr:unnamed protein product [Clonostachys chloroleuca]
MAKFTFPIPGRSKKSPATPTPSEPMTKAHKILGSTNISIDNVSSTNLAHSPAEGKPPRGVIGGGRMNAAGAEALLKELEREWSEESDIAPRYLGVDDDRLHVSDPGVSDPRAMLRQQNSSSTIRSWYDRSKMPLAISQQTSASAMAKGLPTKAERVLDMDNALAAMAKNKKKPAKLDLSRLKPMGRARKGSDLEQSAGNGGMKRSPSVLSPRILHRRPTYEHMRRPTSPEPVRPTTGGPTRPRHPHKEHMNELPDLYKHYEQMSFAQVLGDKAEPSEQQRSSSRNDKTDGVLVELPGDTAYANYRARQGKRKESVDQGPAANPSSPVIEHSHFTQIVRAPTPTKADEQASPTSYAASVSSRHTRTSKASKRTETSFQLADLQEKSMLMLSSDSEEDEEDLFAASPARRRNPSSPTSVRPLSTNSNSVSSSFEGRGEGPSSREVHDPAARQSNSTVKKLSTTSEDLLNIPANALGKTSTLLSPSNSSLGSSHWGATFHLPATPSTLSLASEATTAPMRVWRESTSGSEQFDSQSLATQAPSTLASRESQQDWNNRSYFDSRYSGTTSGRGSSRPSVRPQSSQPTPPLSPSSMDFFIQSARSSIDARASSNEPITNLTRQEQLLITALRQRREDMRKASLLVDDRGQDSRHKSRPSEATITDQSFQSDFRRSTAGSSARLSSLRASGSIASSLNLPISGVREGDDNDSTFTSDSPVFLLSPPPPSRHKPIAIPQRLSRLDTERMTPADDHMVMYLDSPAGPALAISEGAMSPEASGFEDSISSLTNRFPSSPHSSSASRQSRRESMQRQVSIKVGNKEQKWPAISPLLPPQRDLPPIPKKRRPISTEDDDEGKGAGIPRPDSPVDCPISPMAKQFPEVPKDRQTAKNQAARLSAFGPPSPIQGGVAWWGDED